MKDLFSLQGKRILITGAGQGIGFVMAQGLAQYGAGNYYQRYFSVPGR